MYLRVKDFKELDKDLSHAVLRGNLEKVEQLLKTGIEINQNYSILTPYHQTYLGLAVESNNGTMIDLLLQKGAIPNSHSLEAALLAREWDLAVKLIQHSYAVKLDLVKLFQNNVPIEQTNKILDAILQNGTDVTKMSSNWNVTLLQFPFHQNNPYAVKKLVEFGAELSEPIHNDFIPNLPILNYGLMLNLDSSILEFLRQLTGDPSMQVSMMKNSLVKILESIPGKLSDEGATSITTEKVARIKERIRSTLLNQESPLSVPLLRKVQTRLLHILNNPANKRPLLITKILDKNNIKTPNLNNKPTAPFSNGLPYNIANLIEEKLNTLHADEMKNIKPIYKLLEELNQEISRFRKSRLVNYDFKHGRIEIERQPY